MEKKNNSKISIMIIPGTEKVKRISFPDWVPKAMTIAFAVLTLTIFITFKHIASSNINLKREYDDKVHEVSELETENQNKEQELLKLKSQTKHLYEKTSEVEDKLEEIDKLQKRLEKMADMKSPTRGGDIKRNINLKTLEPDEQMDVLAEMLDTKKQDLEIFIKDLENRFEALKHIPDLWPANGRLSSRFGYRRDPLGLGSRLHKGIDISNSPGTSVIAAGKGVVKFSGNKGGYGKTIIINHGNGYETLYAHNKNLLVKVGDKVEKGQIIGKMGSTGRSTGCHLHFEVHKNGTPTNPLDVLK